MECKVVQYGGEDGEQKGLHLLRYEDGICEWKKLAHFRLLVSEKRFARAIRAGKKTSAQIHAQKESTDV